MQHQKSSQLLSCVQAADQVQNIESFKKWTHDYVRPLTTHNALICVHGLVYAAGISLDFLFPIDYPVEHLNAIKNPSGHMDTPLARRWSEQHSPIFFDENQAADDIPAAWLKHFGQSKLINAAVDGVIDKESCIATYFSFHRLAHLDEPTLTQLFKTLTPILHQTYARVIRNHKALHHSIGDYFSRLTQREHEIATWISQGKTNGDIAALLAVTENTIKNHISHIFKKTGCSNRITLAMDFLKQEQSRLGMGITML